VTPKSAEREDLSVIVVGGRADGHAGVVQCCIQDLGGYRILGFYDTLLFGDVETTLGLPVLGAAGDVPPADDACRHAFVAIGHNPVRSEIGENLSRLGYELITLVHPRAYVSPQAKVGAGVYIGPGVSVQRGCHIGDHVIINTGATVDHDCEVQVGVHIAPGACLAGRVTVKARTFVGIGAKVVPDVVIGSDVMVGAGAAVLESTPDKVLVAGVPAVTKKAWSWTDSAEVESAPNNDGPRPNIYVSSPTVPTLPEIAKELDDILNRRMLSNFSVYAQRFEEESRNYLKVPFARTVSNATTGLALALKVLGVTGEVIVPSYTFCATGHAAAWNGCVPVLADVEPDTFTLDLDSVRELITPRTQAVIAVNVFGNPCDIYALQDLCSENNLKLVFDSAHAFGSTYKGVPIGNFGDAEVFSFSGTKVLTTGEGGLVTTRSMDFDHTMELARNYGAGSDYECHFFGFNGKMSEMNAVLGLANLARIEEALQLRDSIAAHYRTSLCQVPGLRFQKIREGCRAVCGYFAAVVDSDVYGRTRDELYMHLESNGVFAKKYFHPPLHEMRAYENSPSGSLNHSTALSRNVLCLPIYPHLPEQEVCRVEELVAEYCRA
jgi:sugar O-acyltransferase (sialic acid O-acetyltransferase NeuD family)